MKVFEINIATGETSKISTFTNIGYFHKKGEVCEVVEVGEVREDIHRK